MLKTKSGKVLISHQIWTKMKKSILLLYCLSIAPIFAQSIVTYNAKELGRIGDRLMLYVKALWIADKFNIPFHHQPFSFLTDHAQNYSIDDFLNLSLSNEIENAEAQPLVEIKNSKSINPLANVAYLISYYYKAEEWEDALHVDTWKGLIDNEIFLEKLRKYIAPTFEFEKINLPADRISVALHVRKGSGSELPLYLKLPNSRSYADKLWPKKFVSDEYFISQIKYVSEQLNNQPIYVHIFTDFHNPKQIAEKYKNAINKPNITYGCREVGNEHCTHTLEDLFNMASFDYLIRGGSNYAQIAHLIGKYKMVVYPRHVRWHGNKMLVTPGVMTRV